VGPEQISGDAAAGAGIATTSWLFDYGSDPYDDARAIAYCYDTTDPDRITGGCFLLTKDEGMTVGKDVTVIVKDTEGIGSHRCTS
jgi:hypothetical protein